MASSTTTTTTANPRVPADHARIGEASQLPKEPSVAHLSLAPLTLPAPKRLFDLQFRITVPVPTASTQSTPLPIILLCHGHGRSNNLSSLNGYLPLTQHWASQGFAVIQPTFLSSATLSLPETTPGAPLFWRERVDDAKHILDNLSTIERDLAAPILHGRTLDKQHIAVAGHSLGGHTANVLLGMSVGDPDDDEPTKVYHLKDSRIKAGILLAAPGSGGQDNLSQAAYENFAFFRHPDFSTMTTPALSVVGDLDTAEHLTVRGPAWFRHPFELSPPAPGKTLVTLKGGWHCLGGIGGFDTHETVGYGVEDESVERVAVVQRVTVAWLRGVLLGEQGRWEETRRVLEGGLNGRVIVEGK